MAKQPNEDLFETTTMTFGEHIEELRVCLVRGLTGLAIGMLIGFLFANNVVELIAAPLEMALTEHYTKVARDRLEAAYEGEVTEEMGLLAAKKGMVFDNVYFELEELQYLARLTADPPGREAELALLDREVPPPSPVLVKTRIWRQAEARLTTLSPTETFMIWLKAAFVTGLVIASPYIFYQIWIFVAAGLYPHEKRYVYVFLPFSLGLFLAGATLAVLFVFGPVLDFLFGFARRMGIDPDLRISEVISFVLVLPLGFGVAFQLPLVMLFLNRIGAFSTKDYLEKWRIAILVIFVISMLLTPADPISMLLMAVPLTILYFLGIALSEYMPRGRNPFNEAYDPS